MVEKNCLAAARLEQPIDGSRGELRRAAGVVTHRGAALEGNRMLGARGLHQLVEVMAHREEAALDGIGAFREQALAVGILRNDAAEAALARATKIDPQIEKAARGAEDRSCQRIVENDGERKAIQWRRIDDPTREVAPHRIIPM